VFKERDQLYRMWYRGLQAPGAFGGPSRGVIGYAESNDGRTWVKVRQPGPLGEALSVGAAGQFDSAGLTTPSVLPRWQHLDHVLRGLRHHRPVSHRPGPGPATMRAFGIAFLPLALAAGAARAQTMLDQEERLIEIHSLLIALQPGNAPGAYRAGELSLGLELIVIPPIDGITGGKRQITASDQTPVFPRPRLAIGLPAPRISAPSSDSPISPRSSSTR